MGLSEGMESNIAHTEILKPADRWIIIDLDVTTP
jgi:hypothetical protein